jgi:hypothetical protein
MLVALEVATVLVVAITMALAVAHALELPGKLRLPKERYLSVQTIYYPGFTLAGLAEATGLLLALVLTLLFPPGSATFWLALSAFVALLAMHAAYWVLTHPVNKFWLKDFKMKGARRGFFAFDPLRRSSASGTPHWTMLRDRWELSHVVRAGLGLVALALLVTAVAL